MEVLVCCERSQVVQSAFLTAGHNAYSCDIEECLGPNPSWHIKGDALDALYSATWDLVIAHPPCTYLSKAGARWLFPLDEHPDRYCRMLNARNFFYEFVRYGELGHRICIENPTPLKIADLPEPSQVVQPYEYGHPYSKRTLLWLYNLSPLLPTDILTEYSSWTDRVHGFNRSIFWPGIAAAMVSAWG